MKYELPMDSDKKDYALALTKAGVGSIPIVGALLAEILPLIVTPSLEKRRSEWMQEVGKGLRDIESKLPSLEYLQSKDNFIDAAVEASRIALSNSQEEIKNALKNAILNTALYDSMESSKQKLFLHFLDTFTEWHIRILKLFDDPESYLKRAGITFRISMCSIITLIEIVFPPLKGEKEFTLAIWNDLYSRTLFTTPNIQGTMSGAGIIARRTSDLGREFLRFIEAPSS